MLQQTFVDREREMRFLEECYRRREPQLLVIYGRRRVGKTELVKRFIKDKPHVYFLADQRGDVFNLIEIKRIMAAHLGDALLEKADIRDWVELFDVFGRMIKERVIVVIDEFPYLAESNGAISSIFQKIWDENLSRKDVVLILLGSSIGLMETHVLGHRAPLYGRRTGQWKVEALKFKHVADFLPYGMEDLIKSYGILDGIPLYLAKFDPSQSLEDNLKTKVFARGQFLYEETEMLLRQELREPANYFNILRAISSGRGKFGDIVNLSMLDKSLVSKYLANLINMRVVEKEFPVTQGKETRNARYRFTDNYVNFWFRFVYPNKSLIEEDMQDRLLERIRDDLNLHYSRIFEDVCLEFLRDRTGKNFIFDKIGRWWHKEREIDIVALNERTHQILFCECKWRDNVDAEKTLAELRKKAAYVDWNNKNRDEHYAVIGKTLRKKVTDDNTTCYDLEDINGQ